MKNSMNKPDLNQTLSFRFNEDLFEGAYIEYEGRKQAKSSPAKTGKTIFSWKKVKLHHISVGANGVDYLIHDGIIICSFPLKKDRNEIYEFLDKYWDERIFPFCEYIKKRRECESISEVFETEEPNL